MELSTPLSKSQLGVVAFGIASIGYGTRAILAPFEFAKAFGLPQPATNPTNPFIATTGGRTAAIGVAVVTLSLLGNVRASGVVIMSCAVSGLTDTITTYSANDSNAFIQHAVGTVVLGALGWYLSTLQ